jgi:hypothetical protein
MAKNFEYKSIESSNFSRNFSKEYAQPVRDETARRIREVRNMDNDLTHEEIMNSNNEELISSYNKLKENFWGRIFKSKKYLTEKAALDIVISNFKKEKKDICINEIKKNFNQTITELMKNTPLSEEEQEKYLSMENVLKMDVPDYLTLMNRLSGLYFSHVTRFGLRERNSPIAWQHFKCNN